MTASRLDKFEYLLEKVKKQGGKLARCISDLEKISSDNELNMFYFGGFLRDLWLGNTPRDIDIVLNSYSEELFDKLIREHKIGSNRFGGFRLDFEGIRVDAWPVHRTYAFANSLVLPSSINRLPETTVFNAEGIVLEVYPAQNVRLGWERNFFEACESRTLEMQGYTKILFPDLQIVRAYEIQKNLGWSVGPALREFIRHNLSNHRAEELATVYKNHYEKDISAGEIYSRVKKLVS